MSRTGWMLTLNNYTDDELDQYRRIIDKLNDEGHDNVRFLAFQEEVGESGTPHLQIYVLFKTKIRMSAVKGVMPGGRRLHCEVRKGSHSEAKAYCMKEDSRKAGGLSVCAGDEPSPGSRSDLVRVKARLDDGAKEVEIADEFFGQWVRYHKAFQRYRGLKLPNRSAPTFTQVYWGPPGTGKTRAAFDEAGPDAYWLPKPNGSRVFWDGYEGQDNVVIDEFFGWMPRDLMCRICDRYPFRVETKGGSVPFVAKKVWITSNIPPCEWWPRVGLGPMSRRLTEPLGSSVKMPSLDHREPDQPGLVPAPPIIVD